jgi:hypothetical protein
LNKEINKIKKTRKEGEDLYSLVLFGKHCSKEGRGRKSGEEGSTVFFFSLVAGGGSNVKVALAPDARERAQKSFLHAAADALENPGGKKAVVMPFLVTAEDVKIAAAWTDAMERKDHK